MQYYELANAISMFVPVTIAIIIRQQPCATMLSFAWLLIAPFSILYHSFASFGNHNNLLRKLDQTFQCVAAPCITWALSQEKLYTLLLAIAALYPIVGIWRHDDNRRWQSIGVLLTVCSFPHLAFHDIQILLFAILACILGFLSFAYRKNQNYFAQPIFHVIAGLWTLLLAQAAETTCSF